MNSTSGGIGTGGRRAVAVALACAALAAMANMPSDLQRAESDLRAGRLDQAQALVAEQLHLHPAEARVHYVAAELRARQGERDPAREELAAAERLAPGLPFADAQAVQALHRQIDAAAMASPFSAALPSPDHAGQPWKLWVALASGTALAWLLMRLVQPPPPPVRGRRPDVADLVEARTLLREQGPRPQRAWQDTVAGWEEIAPDNPRPTPCEVPLDVSTASAPAWQTDSPHRAR